MYEKQRSSMDLSELIFDPEITTAIASSFIDTPTMSLTPTTLATFEAEFNEAFTASQALTTEALVSQSSGGQFWPAASTSLNNFQLDSDDNDDDDDDNDDDDDSSMDSNSNFTGVTTKNNQGGSKVGPKSAAKGVKQQREVCAVKPVEQKQRKLPGPRPSKPIEEMTPIEAERRRRRRERNKNAAAKCRQRRLELTNELLAETEMLELESSRLEREIENLRRVKSQLEFVLESHKPICTAIFPVDSEFIPYPPPVQTTNAATTVGNVCVVRPNNLPIPSFSTASHASSTTLTSEALEGAIFSFDTPTNLAGLTPFLAAAELGSPSSFNLFSP